MLMMIVETLLINHETLVLTIYCVACNFKCSLLCVHGSNSTVSCLFCGGLEERGGCQSSRVAMPSKNRQSMSSMAEVAMDDGEWQ